MQIQNSDFFSLWIMSVLLAFQFFAKNVIATFYLTILSFSEFWVCIL